MVSDVAMVVVVGVTVVVVSGGTGVVVSGRIVGTSNR